MKKKIKKREKKAKMGEREVMMMIKGKRVKSERVNGGGKRERVKR